jgi:hypothetical protein
MIHLGTEQAARNRMIRVTADMDGIAVFNSNQQTAGIGAVVGTDGTDGDGHRWNPFLLKKLQGIVPEIKKQLQLNSFWCDNRITTI